MKQFYTYVYHDPERQVPIYVGKGYGQRSQDHLGTSGKNSRFKNRIKVLKRKGLLPTIEVFFMPTESAAFLAEVELIAKYGRKDLGKGTLYNMTDGGEGCAGLVHTMETKRKRSIAVKASYTPELRQLRSDMQKGVGKSESTKAAMAQGATNRWSSPEAAAQKEHLSRLAKARVGIASPKSKTWSLEDPNGVRYLTSSCRIFCEERGLSFPGFRNKGTAKDKTPILKGKSKGWSVLACTEKV
jgi:hypothetical protein